MDPGPACSHAHPPRLVGKATAKECLRRPGTSWWAPWAHASPGPSGSFSPATRAPALIPGCVCVNVRGPGAWSPRRAEAGVQSSSWRWHPRLTWASEMQLLPGRPGDRPPGYGALLAGSAGGVVCPGWRGAGGWVSRWSRRRGLMVRLLQLL